MDITVYLPDDIGTAAKAADLNLSRLLRDAVGQELARREAVAKQLDGAREYELDLENAEGERYVGLLTGQRLTEEDPGGATVYLAADERLLVHDANRGALDLIEDVEDLRDRLGRDDYIAVCAAVGEVARVEV